jgi:hypothetical protein
VAIDRELSLQLNSRMLALFRHLQIRSIHPDQRRNRGSAASAVGLPLQNEECMEITRKNHQCRHGLDRGVGGDGPLSKDCQLMAHCVSISTTRFPAVSGPPTQGLRATGNFPFREWPLTHWDRIVRLIRKSRVFETRLRSNPSPRTGCSWSFDIQLTYELPIMVTLSIRLRVIF